MRAYVDTSVNLNVNPGAIITVAIWPTVAIIGFIIHAMTMAISPGGILATLDIMADHTMPRPPIRRFFLRTRAGVNFHRAPVAGLVTGMVKTTPAETAVAKANVLMLNIKVPPY